VKSETRKYHFLILIIIIRTNTATHLCHGLHLSLSLFLLSYTIYNDIWRGGLQVYIYIYCVRWMLASCA
jgi:hypothetical protein